MLTQYEHSKHIYIFMCVFNDIYMYTIRVGPLSGNHGQIEAPEASHLSVWATEAKSRSKKDER